VLQEFKTKYGYWPGDLPNASSFWTTCTSATGDGGNCNGNGDGYIGIKNQNWWGGTTYNNNENLRAWQHLNLAGYLAVPYTGFGASATNGTEPGVNSPKSSYSGAIYTFWGDCCYTGNNYYILQLAGQTGPVLGSGGWQVDAAPIGAYPSLSTKDAYYLDNKMDDGLPTTGKVWARSSDVNTWCGGMSTAEACVNSASNSYYITNIGNSTNKGRLCMMHFFYQ
jgi:hypothetical protein